jgi:hypothetical protein
MSVPITCLRPEKKLKLQSEGKVINPTCLIFFQSTCSRNSDLAMDGRHSNHDSILGKEKVRFLFSNSRPTLGLTSCPFNAYRGLIPASKIADAEDDHLLPSTAEVKNKMMYNSNPINFNSTWRDNKLD